MATRIYEYAKMINRELMWNIRKSEQGIIIPVIAKGNIYQGIIAQW